MLIIPAIDLKDGACVRLRQGLRDDILLVLAEWGNAGPAGDSDCNGTVDFDDLLEVLAAWGDGCSPAARCRCGATRWSVESAFR